MKQLNDSFQKEFDERGTIADSHPVQEVNGTKFV